jgi:hypothetical protein
MFILIEPDEVPDVTTVPLTLIVDNESTAVGVNVRDVTLVAILNEYAVVEESRSGLSKYPFDIVKDVSSVESLTSLIVTPLTCKPEIFILY